MSGPISENAFWSISRKLVQVVDVPDCYTSTRYTIFVQLNLVTSLNKITLQHYNAYNYNTLQCYNAYVGSLHLQNTKRFEISIHSPVHWFLGLASSGSQ